MLAALTTYRTFRLYEEKSAGVGINLLNGGAPHCVITVRCFGIPQEGEGHMTTTQERSTQLIDLDTLPKIDEK